MRRFIAICSLSLSLSLANTVLASFFQGFETNINGWDVFGGQYDATRVTSGTDGVSSKTGSFHAEAGQFDLDNAGGSAATRWGLYSSTFPVGGYTTDISVYLDTGISAANDTRFDWDSAIGSADCGFRRDFVFNAGYYNDTDATGAGPRFVISASTNAGRGGAYPKNPGKDPFTIAVTGWYTLEHQFSNNSGVLVVTMRILDSSGVPLHTWTQSDPTDLIGATIGGNRYGWFASQEFTFLAFDDSALNGLQSYCQSGPGTGSIGYWLNNQTGWCITSMGLGCTTYTKAQCVAILKKSNLKSRDMTYLLAAQLIAAKLNVACLGSNSSCVSQAITDADNWLCAHPIGSNVKANSATWKQITPTYNTLAAYNEGELCAPPRIN